MTINEMKQSYKQSYTDNVELSIFNCGHEYCQPGHTWGPGVRDHYLIHLVVAGKGVYQVNGASHTLQEGDLFLAKPNQLITYAADETDPWEYYWVGFNGACANKLVQQTPFSDAHPVHHCKDPQTVREALYNIYLSRGPEPQCEALMTGYLYIFMAHLMKEAREAMPNVGSSSSQYVLAAIKYIQFNYSHDISVDDIAKAVGVSRSHLYRVFMSNVGQSPIDYLTSYRISEACSLLKNSSLSIAEIAVFVWAFLTSSIFPACSKRSRACRRASTWPRWRRRVLPHRRPSTRNISRTIYKEQTCLLRKIRSLLWRSKRSPTTETAWPTRTVRPFLCR